ncbi:hypothetical protein [Hyalangium sp.]|uniref:hypothetical protein n=1 Tax=Hyalangium sp. TaxID=2028555 RepID=UPI002D4C7201|nr:hypothetical protein [Hyalangium sp.]HYI00815.1 hypothetical protein [Hyalangium sp.]
MSPPRFVPLLLCLLLPLPGLAQSPVPHEQPVPPVTPPPLVPAPSEPSDSPLASPEEADPEDTPRGEIIHREWHPDTDPSPTFPRLLLEVLGGTVGATVGFIPGGLVILSAFCIESCDDGAESRAILGLGLALAGIAGGTAIGITGAGSLLQGEGEYWPTAGGAAIGTLVGSIVGLALASSADEAALIPVLVGPIMGGMIAYELSHSNAVARRQLRRTSQPQVVPMATVTPRGGFIGGLAGRF